MPGKQGAQNFGKSGSQGDRDIILRVLQNAAPDGLKFSELRGGTGLGVQGFNQALDFLVGNGSVKKEGDKYYINQSSPS